MIVQARCISIHIYRLIINLHANVRSILKVELSNATVANYNCFIDSTFKQRKEQHNERTALTVFLMHEILRDICARAWKLILHIPLLCITIHMCVRAHTFARVHE